MPGSQCPRFCRFVVDKSIELEKADNFQTYVTEVIYNLFYNLFITLIITWMMRVSSYVNYTW